MGRLIFISGGARSGKSTFAENRAKECGDSVLYIATATAFDDEMHARIEKHKQSRPAHFVTLEAFSGLEAPIAQAQGTVLIDCITVMITNLLMKNTDIDWDYPTTTQIQAEEDAIMLEIDAILRGAKLAGGEVLVVSNEVGLGLVPPYPMGRAYRDIAGRANQRLAAASDEAFFLVSGLPLRLK